MLVAPAAGGAPAVMMPDAAPAPLKDYLNYVDTLTGTGTSDTPSAVRHGGGTELRPHTLPMVGVPHGMTHLTPQTRVSERKCIAPYYFEDTMINGFRATHWLSGSCVQDYGSFSLMPVAGDLRVLPEERAVAFSHDDELATAALYELELANGVQVRMSAVSRSGIFEFEFPQGQPAYLLFEPNSDEGLGQVTIDAATQSISANNLAHRIYQGNGQPTGFSGFAAVVFEQAFAEFGTYSLAGPQAGNTTATGNGERFDLVGAYVRFEPPADGIVRAKLGTSFTDSKHARANLEAEIPGWDLAEVQRQAKAAWNSLLNRFQVTGSEQDMTKFYTGLYHALLHPRTLSDVDGSYPEFGGSGGIAKAEDFTYHCDFPAWDTFRAVHPMLTLLAPEKTLDFVRSLVKKGEQGGWMPIFPMWNSYTSAMIGDHTTSIIVDAYRKGIDDFDLESAYALMKQNAYQSPPRELYVDGRGRRGLAAYLEHGYIPLEEPVPDAFHQKDQVSRTLEYAYDDFVLAQFARDLGKPESTELLQRAGNYRNVFDPTTGFMRGRHEDGSWVADFDPAAKTSYFTEGTAWHYTWFVPHDVAGLIELLGREAFVERLDELFASGLYWHGNEPGHHIPFLYIHAGEAHKTQNIVRELQDTEYSIGPGGITGNDDAGQISSWYVLTALGLYAVAPGLPYYALTSPVFEQSVLQLGEKQFTISAPGVSAENRYIQSATLNGQPYDRAWIEHEALVQGGALELVMGPEPNPAFGQSELPPSMSKP